MGPRVGGDGTAPHDQPVRVTGFADRRAAPDLEAPFRIGMAGIDEKFEETFEDLVRVRQIGVLFSDPVQDHHLNIHARERGAEPVDVEELVIAADDLATVDLGEVLDVLVGFGASCRFSVASH